MRIFNRLSTQQLSVRACFVLAALAWNAQCWAAPVYTRIRSFGFGELSATAPSGALIEGTNGVLFGVADVNGAVVMLCAETSPITGGWGGAYIDTPGQLDLKLSGASHAETGTEGDFKIQTNLSTGVLIAAHKMGFAERKFDKINGAVVLRLQPWGFVEGKLRIGSRPGANKTSASQCGHRQRRKVLHRGRAPRRMATC